MDKYNLTNDIIRKLVGRVNRVPVTNDNMINISSKIEERLDYSDHHILVVFTGTNIGLTEVLREVSRARKYGFTFDVAFSFSGAHVLGEEGMNEVKKALKPNKIYNEEDQLIFNQVIESVDGIMVPMATQDIASKLVLGIQDNFISTLLWRSLWNGKTVLMDFDNVLTYGGVESKNPMLAEIMKDYVEKLQKIGVIKLDKSDYSVELINKFKNVSMKIEDSQNLQSSAQSQGLPKIMTEKDLLSAVNNNNEIIVPIKTIITPQALDTAKKQGITIIRK
ncbi:putative flavoprotein [Gottschalkia acidurici 9a]|uniref:Flavoprotein n=1 Tax=Gottschalkia acidurici (strain ATCC 7906 / DSM 604 / BCRC 14475 / CIP 104303 / KCTC 5404 / NCIMB 10678 / 9a) TaxID=1128398 RepID=K0B5X0_GOTA9|nr:flavoprotein [Gottschalkia acidurici]AFS79871.1 putative flavoprotein [Gottschalkia acidurici 9a]